MRTVAAIPTTYNGTEYRSKTEARWAVFFDYMGVTFQYEPGYIQLSNGNRYLPDFFIEEFDAYFEVKPDNDVIVTAECTKARQLSIDNPAYRVWLAMGPPAADTSNILVLEEWEVDEPLENILSDTERKYIFMEDRRDEGVYWLYAYNLEQSMYRHCFCIGGIGSQSDHDRAPMIHRRVREAYDAVLEHTF